MQEKFLYNRQFGDPTTVLPVANTYCLYCRKSTESEEKQALSIDSQAKEMLQLAQKENLNVTEILRESHSAKAQGQRPVFNEMLEGIRAGKFNSILTWHPDRLARNAGDLGALVDLMDQHLIQEIRTYGQKFTNNPSEKFLLMILGSQSKLENDNKSVNVKRGMKAKCSLGLWPGMAPTGYVNSKNVDQKGQVFLDPVRAPIIKEMFSKVANDGWSGKKIYLWLREVGFTSRNGKPFAFSNVYMALNNHFYYGSYEYPKGSGQWYQGKHQPIISKDIFDAAQQQLHLQHRAKNKNKEFAFTKLMTCGLCGSGITAQEKFKNLKDGGVNKYVYYGCAKTKDVNCKCGYLREEELISQLITLIDQIDIDELNLKRQLDSEFERYNKFQVMFGREGVDNTKNIEPRAYAKYLLKSGSIIEKRELLGSLKSRLILQNKLVTLEK